MILLSSDLRIGEYLPSIRKFSRYASGLSAMFSNIIGIRISFDSAFNLEMETTFSMESLRLKVVMFLRNLPALIYA